MTEKEKKCQPLKCKTFSKLATRKVAKDLTYDQVLPVDEIVVKCPHRTEKCMCTNEQEALNERYY